MDRMQSSEMSRRAFLKSAALAPAGIGLAAKAVRAGAKRRRRPNILYMMTDQHRGDCLGCAGNKAIKTPNLDSIAKDGVLFSNAYSSTPSCTPARSGILTGLSPWHHGMIGYGRVAQKHRFELPGAMREAGYYLFGIGKMHWYPQRKLRGYHGILLDESGRAQTKGFVSDYRQWFKKEARTADRAVEFIESYERDEPFMLKVSFARPHSPYDPPQRFADTYSVEEMPKPHVGKWAQRYAGHTDPPKPSLWRGDLGVEQAKKARRYYYGSITLIDEQIGRILAALKKRRLYDNTLIIFFSDHGDMLGDHHLWRKTYAYEGSAKVPMLIRWPASMGMEEQRGKKLTKVVELRDVLPTFLDTAGADSPGHLDGKSMLELIRGNTEGWRKFVDLEHSMCYSKEHWCALTDGKHKYIYYAYDGREELFDLIDDPGEVRDLAGQTRYKDVLERWRGYLVGHLSERGREFVRDGKLAIRKKRLLYSPNFPKKA